MIAAYITALGTALAGDGVTVSVAPVTPTQIVVPAVYLVPNGRRPGTMGAPWEQRWRAIACVQWQTDAGSAAVTSLDEITDAIIKAGAGLGIGWERSEYLGRLIAGAGGPDLLAEVHHLLFPTNGE